MGILKPIRWKFLLAVFKLRRLANQLLGTRILDYPKHKILILTDTIREYQTRAQSASKEKKTIAWIENQAKDSKAILYDIGANVGAYALVSASCGITVFAFEPAYQNYYKLSRNISLNKFDHLITAIPLALSNRKKAARFVQEDQSFGATASLSADQERLDGRGVAMLTMDLDSCMKTFSLPVPTMVKIDVDGAELEVLDGAALLLENKTLSSILVEVSTVNFVRVKEVLNQKGFKLTDEERMDPETVNYIFSRT